MPFKVEGVPVQSLAAYWGEVLPMLQPALERDDDEVSMGEVFDLLCKERAMLWVIGNDQLVGAMVVVLKPSSVMVWLLGGVEFDKWHEAAESALVRYAQEMGREKIIANVRPGLGRKLKAWRRIQETVALDGWQIKANGHTPDDARDEAA